jgi:hypothetical protein
MTTSNQIWLAIRKEPLFAIALVIGAVFEYQNHYTLLSQFMAELHNSGSWWDNFLGNLGSFLGAMFLVTSIVATGFRKRVVASWTLAAITCGVSFAVYSRIDIDWATISPVHIAISILSFLLPILVAYFTHQIGHHIEADEEDEVEALRRNLEKQERMERVRRQYSHIKTPTLPKTEQAQTIYRNGVPLDDLLKGEE